MGRRDDFRDFAESRATRLRGTAYLYCGNWHTAEDLVQITLTKLYVAWPKIVRNGTEDAYARKVLLNSYLDLQRKGSSGELPSDTLPDTPAAGSDTETRMALLNAMNDLPPRQRAVLVLRYFEDLDVATTAKLLDTSEGNVKSTTSRALAAMPGVLARHDLSPMGENRDV